MRQRFKAAVRSFIVFIFSGLIFIQASGAAQTIRWTKFEDNNADFSHVLSVLSERTGHSFTSADFRLVEDRELAYTHYRRYLQIYQGVPVTNLALRIWFDEETGMAIQVEANLENPVSVDTAIAANLRANAQSRGGSLTPGLLSDTRTRELARRAIAQDGQDQSLQGMTWTDAWALSPQAVLTRVVNTKARRGEYTVTLNAVTGQILQTNYREYPQSGETLTRDEFSIPARIFPIYERAEGGDQVLARVPGQLKYIYRRVARPRNPINPFAELTEQHYIESMMDPIASESDIGRSSGYWSMAYIKRRATEIRAAMPLRGNSFPREGRHGGVILDGRYASINLHPAVPTHFHGLTFTPSLSSLFRPDWRETSLPSGSSFYEMVPSSTLIGRRIRSREDAWNRPARILPNNDPVAYLNDGFDELQVYYAVNTLFDQLKTRGWIDPDLSTRPFHAFLFDPDIAMKDNAYYTDDTINFTTYSPGHPNFARDNPTIWHELGHGVMDRMMGDFLHLADTGGLSEGMADFVAALVVQAVTQGQAFPGSREFRIINKTGFHLTNEVHDDGEAYGGSMKDLLDASIRRFGAEGLNKITDLTLEAMRLCRDHPALTASEWFSHMLFADQLGRRSIRAPGELRDLILEALRSRNFNLNDSSTQNVARFILRNETDGQEVTSRSAGSRNNPVPVRIARTEMKDYELSVKLEDSERYRFVYPVTIKVQLRGGPIQGAIKWVGEETQPLTFTIPNASSSARVPLQASGQCDYANRDDGSCVDFAYVQVFNHLETEKPVAKKRFYLRVSAQ